jgi:hypothetical protein
MDFVGKADGEFVLDAFVAYLTDVFATVASCVVDGVTNG